MGIIKLPKKSIEFYKENIDEIFESGTLAEGKWNNEISSFIIDMTGASKAIPTSSNGSGLVAILNIYSYYFNRKKCLIQSNTMYGVSTLVRAVGCTLDGFFD